MNASDYCRGHR